MLLRNMPWRDRGIIITLTLVHGGIYWLFMSDTSFGLKYVLVLEVLLCAAYFDIKTRLIPDWIHVMALGIGMVGVQPVAAFVGMLITAMPFLVIELFHEGSVGGGDIKLMGVIGFCLGGGVGLLIAGVTMVLVLLCKNVVYRNLKNSCYISVPLVPHAYLATFFLLRSELVCVYFQNC